MSAATQETQKKPMKLCIDFKKWQLDAKHSCRAGGITGILPQSLMQLLPLLINDLF